VTTLIINPSSIISTYCYSIYRVETDSTCELACRYCYARWYRINDRKLTLRHLEEFRRFISYVSENLPRAPVFRMSTLVEPLQDRSLVRAEHVLKLCNVHNIPLIVNTKSLNLVRRDEILEQVLKLADKNLILVQVSLCTLDEAKARLLEPRAPTPSERMEMMDILKQHGVKTVLRYQPTIPGIADVEYPQIVKLCRELSIGQIIIEPIRIERNLLLKLREQIPEISIVEWEPYTEIGGLVKPCDSWTRTIIEKFRKEAETHNISLATCKDPKINILCRAEDCCGIYMINKERSLKKATIYEMKKFNIKTTNVDTFLEKIEEISQQFIGRTYISKIPKEHRKKIRSHYKILIEKSTKQDVEIMIIS